MNKSVILFHLKEAMEELQATVKQLEEDNSYEIEELQIGMDAHAPIKSTESAATTTFRSGGAFLRNLNCSSTE